jgi:Xaa-Pro dipeptidase
LTGGKTAWPKPLQAICSTWKPSLTGTKSEDTILTGSKSPEMISPPILYPTFSMGVDGINFVRPHILEMGA